MRDVPTIREDLRRSVNAPARLSEGRTGAGVMMTRRSNDSTSLCGGYTGPALLRRPCSQLDAP
jgi:hypothetical protein